MDQPRLVFSSAGMNRLGPMRRDSDWIRKQLTQENALILPLWRGKVWIRKEERYVRALSLRWHQVRSQLQPDHCSFLGQEDHVSYFTVELGDANTEPEQICSAVQGEFADLKQVSPLLSHFEANKLAYAQGLLYWHRQQEYCGRCGERTESRESGHVRVCLNGDCGAKFFPRTDPAIITLVECGDYCLLGRQSSWPSGVYSTLAGFVEPGESLEDAVRREVFEETAVQVSQVQYQGSQPWPFPSSLMLGFRASANSLKPVHLLDGELEDARWLRRSELLSGESDIRFPPRVSIARSLIDSWLHA